MIMTFIISGVLMPPFVWSLLYFRITDQYSSTEQADSVLIETKAEAQKYMLKRTVKNPFFWIYIGFSFVMLFASACSVNIFNLGDWFFSL